MIKDILSRHGFRFNKRYGQNFITDTNLLNAIANDAEINNKDTVVEIGAGAGTLTRVLSEKSGRVICYEIDRSLQPVLEETLSGRDNTNVIYADFMKERMERLEHMAGGMYKVVANLPYYITTPVIMRFAEEAEQAQSLTIMVQKEVADRLTAAAGTKQYGAVTVAINSVANVSLTRIVRRSMFYPVPNVDSAVVRIDFDSKKKERITDSTIYRRAVKSAFAMRRKTLANNLSAAFGITNDRAADIIRGMGLTANVRGETLDINQFLDLSKQLKLIITDKTD